MRPRITPQRFLSGDDNFAIAKVPVKSGLLAFSTNASIAFTAERHGNGGNIGLADGSVRAAGLVSLCQTTNRFSTINQAAKAGRMMRPVSCNPAMTRLSPRAVG